MFAAGLALWMGLLGPLPEAGVVRQRRGSAYVIVVRFAGSGDRQRLPVVELAVLPRLCGLASAHGIDAAEDQSRPGAIWMIEGSMRDDLRARLAVPCAGDAPGRGAAGAVEHARAGSSSTRAGAGRSRRARTPGRPPGPQRTARPSRTSTTRRRPTTIT